MISNLPHAHNRGLKQKNYEVLVKAKCPACVAEGAFVTHDTVTNGQWFQLKDNLSGIKDKIAYGIDNGIDAYYGFGPRPTFMIIIQFGSQRASVQLVWGSSPASGVTGYNVYRRIHPNHNYEMIAGNVPDTTYIDNSVTVGKIYSYYVKARRSSGQESIRSDIVTCQIPPFSSNCTMATGVNTGRGVVFDPGGNGCLAWTNQSAIWCATSTDYGISWSNAKKIDYGWQPAIDTDSTKKLKVCHIGTLGVPDSAAQETLTYTINYARNRTDFWNEEVIYETHDSILSVSFAIDPLDTGWVVFNTYDDEGNNKLKIGKFYTQTMPESLENVIDLDTYVGYGIGPIGIKSSDRSLHIVYEKNGAIMYLQRDNLGNWTTPFQVGVGKNPSLSVAGDLIHLIWERWYPSYTKIQTYYTNGKYWSWIYEIKIFPVSSFRSNPIPLYAFDLGEKEPTVFVEKRTGYIIYGSGFEKNVDYDTNCLKYRITGLDPKKNYQVGLVFYQNESNGI